MKTGSNQNFLRAFMYCQKSFKKLIASSSAQRPRAPRSYNRKRRRSSLIASGPFILYVSFRLLARSDLP